MGASTRCQFMDCRYLAAILAMSFMATGASALDDPLRRTADQLADAIVADSDCCGGMVSVIGAPDAELAIALAKRGPFTVHCLSSSTGTLDQLRQSIRAEGLYGTVAAMAARGGRLPYADNSMNLVVVCSLSNSREAIAASLAELQRVLSPLGTAFVNVELNQDGSAESESRFETASRQLGLEPGVGDRLGRSWAGVRKPWPDDIDEWSHFLHGADGNPVARDLVVGPPRHYQWTAGPDWLRSHETDSSISTMVTSQGRLFYIVDEAPISLPGNHSLPDKWALVARDAFNGKFLWRVPIRRWGWREWKNTWFVNRPGDFPLNIRKRLVAVGNDVFVTLGYHAPISRIDARTGEILQTYDETEAAAEILLSNGTLVAAVLSGDRVKFVAVDPDSEKLLWESEATYRGTTVDYLRWPGRGAAPPPKKIDPALNLAADGNVVAFVDGPDIVCLDFKTGEKRWRSKFPDSTADRSAGGINSRGDLWAGTMITTQGVVLHASPSQLVAFSQDTGDMLWSQPKKYIGHLWYEWKDVFVIDDLVWTWSAEFDQAVINTGQGRGQRQQWPRTANGYQVRTGELKKQVELGAIFRTHHHHRCYRNKATSRYIVASRRGTEFVDLVGGKHTVDNWVRGTCHVGMMPANGLQYVPPHPCQCYLEEKLIGFNALASNIASPGTVMPDSERVAKGPAFQMNERTDGVGAADLGKDWPAFRHDPQRTGSIESSVSADLVTRWSKRLGEKVSAPISVGDQVFVSLVDEHQIVALAVGDGEDQWRFTTGGRIDSPPTYYRGRIIVGSADGSVYAIHAGTGKLVWKFDAAPYQRLIGVDSQLESAWPVHGSVLVQNDRAYFAAGRSSQLDGGVYVYCLDASTGQILYKTNLDGPHYNVDNVTENYNLPMGALPDILLGDGTRVFMRAIAFDDQLERIQDKPALTPMGGFLDDNYFKRTPWRYRGGDYGRLIVHDSRSVYYVRMFDSLKGLDPTVYFTPGRKGYLLFAKDQNGRRDAWRTRISVRIRAMVLAGERLFVAGPPDVVDAKDPLGSFEGRLGGKLHVFGRGSGNPEGEYDLDSPPVFNGMAAANGALYVTDEHGGIVCFAEK